MSLEIKFGHEAKEKLQSGINKLANSVITTLGPNGRNVIFTDEYGNIRSTKDGVTIAKMVKNLPDPIEDMGASMIKQASIKTANSAGDGTTTSTLLAASLINQGLKTIKEGSNAVEVKRGMDEAVNEVVKALKELSEDITSEEQIRQVATISANNDSDIGELIATAMDKVGNDGVVSIEESRTGETSLEVVEGMQFDRGYKSPYFVTNNNDMTSILDNPLILIYDKKINQAKELLPILEYVSNQNNSLLIVADDIDGEALATLIVNKARSILKVCAVKAPGFGDNRQHLLEDIATITGGQVVSSDKGMRLDKFNPSWFGNCRVATVSKETTTLVDGKGSEEDILERIEDIKSQIDKASSQYDKEKLQERLGKLVGGVALINIGAATEIEMKEKKDRVEDALYATKAALAEGILPGGGVALVHAREAISYSKENSDSFNLGKKIVYNALQQPFNQILINAGYDTPNFFMYQLSKHPAWVGFNIKTDTFDNMKEVGILDPTKVTRTALQNAVSVAGTILITECALYEKPEDKKDVMGNNLDLGF